MGEPESPTTTPKEEKLPLKEVGKARIVFYEDGSSVFIPVFLYETAGKVVERCMRILGENMTMMAPGFASAHDSMRTQPKEIGH